VEYCQCISPCVFQRSICELLGFGSYLRSICHGFNSWSGYDRVALSHSLVYICGPAGHLVLDWNILP
jgi:hypothetical protein